MGPLGAEAHAAVNLHAFVYRKVEHFRAVHFKDGALYGKIFERLESCFGGSRASLLVSAL